MHPSLAALEAELHEVAAGAAGHSDFGAPDYVPGLRELLKSLDADSQLTEMGYQFAYGGLVGTLCARLHAERGWRERPACLDNPIRRPLVITGMPRTGTTALHKLLSMDPQFQGLERWLTETPMTRPPRETWPHDPAYLRTVANLEAYFKAMPQMRAAHDMVADEVDECLEVLCQSFVSNRFASGMNVPGYARWLSAQSEAGSYRRYGDVLRLIGADEPAKRWLLKNPGHVAQIDALLEIFPDACVVQTHRDPVVTIGSLCSTLHMARQIFEGEAADPKVLGARECRYWQQAVERTHAVRQSRDRQFFDVDHRRFHQDPMGVARGIYEHFDLTLSPAAERTMRDWTLRNPTSRHGRHAYDLEDYGVTRQQVGASFADYRRRQGYG